MSKTETRKPFIGKTVPLHKLCKSITDCHHSTPVWSDSGKIVVRNFNIKRGKLDLSTPSYTNEKTYIERTSRAKPEAGDLIISREAPMGEVCVIPEGIDCCLGQRMVLIKPDQNKIGSKYLLYAMLSEFVQGQINQSNKTGSIVSNLRIPLLKELEIPLLNGTEKIAAVLSALDAKIDCNNRINAELEAMAKTLYDYWFVQFDFPFDFAQGKPDKNGKPYRSSGGKMVYNPTLKREIPAGWEVLALKDLVDLVKGNVSPSDVDANTPYIGLEHIGRKTIMLSDWANSDSANSDKTAFRKNDILFGKIRPYFHKVTVAPFDGITSTDTIILRPKSNHFFGLAFETIFSDVFVETATRSSTGSKMPRADWNVLQHYKVPVPDVALLESFHSIFEKSLEKIHLSTTENQHLTQLRDWLLPMLMNGQVTVQ